MKKISGSLNFPKDAPSPVVAMGNFDGVHLGHRHIIDITCSMALKLKGTVVVYTFEPHPVRILAPAECPPLIQTLEQKLVSLKTAGVDICVVEEFTASFARMEPLRFFSDIIVKRLHAASVVAGYDFTFGLQRQGTTDRLMAMGKEAGIDVHVIEAQFLEETLISSTNIRRLLESGMVVESAKLLGRSYRIKGKVVPGRGIGGELGAHTANIKSENELIPKNGVYVTRTDARDSITSIGDNPTFPGSPFAIETHLIDWTGRLEGKMIEVEFIDRLRDQKAFASKEELKEQIKKDIDLARKFFCTL